MNSHNSGHLWKNFRVMHHYIDYTPHHACKLWHMIEIFRENMAANQFEVEAMVHCYQEYKDILEATLGETLSDKENGKIHDIYAVAVLRSG